MVNCVKALRLNHGTDDSRTMKTIDLRSDTITQPTDEMMVDTCDAGELCCTHSFRLSY